MILDASVERTIVSLAVLVLACALIIAAMYSGQMAYFVAVVGLCGPWVGSVLANWFNGISSPTVPMVKEPVSHVAAPPALIVNSPPPPRSEPTNGNGNGGLS